MDGTTQHTVMQSNGKLKEWDVGENGWDRRRVRGLTFVVVVCGMGV